MRTGIEIGPAGEEFRNRRPAATGAGRPANRQAGSDRSSPRAGGIYWRRAAGRACRKQGRGLSWWIWASSASPPAVTPRRSASATPTGRASVGVSPRWAAAETNPRRRVTRSSVRSVRLWPRFRAQPQQPARKNKLPAVATPAHGHADRPHDRGTIRCVGSGPALRSPRSLRAACPNRGSYCDCPLVRG